MLDLDLARDLMPRVLGRLDEPIGDASILPTFLLSCFTRQKVTVALSGDGGDELFAGYDPFKALTPAKVFRQLVPRGARRGLQRLVDLLPVSDRNMGPDFKLRRSLKGVVWPEQYWNPVWLSPADPNTIRDLFEEPLTAEDLYEEAIALWEQGRGDVVDRTLEFYTNFYLADDILTKVDRASMMVSLELRAIFLDNDLVEFVDACPTALNCEKGSGNGSSSRLCGSGYRRRRLAVQKRDLEYR